MKSKKVKKKKKPNKKISDFDKALLAGLNQRADKS